MAASACTSLLPTATASTTVTTTTISAMTFSTTMEAARPSTVNQTRTESTTVTITAGATSTVTLRATSVYISNTTVTTYVPAPAASAARLSSRKRCSPSTALISLKAMPADSLATACACIGEPASTTTSTSIITTSVVTTVTDVQGAPSTTTVLFLDRVAYTVTVPPLPRTLTLNTTTSITATSTLSLAAPTFTQVFGPKAGCANIADGPAHTLKANIANMANATETCKDICAQEPRCAHVYVQHMFTHYGRAKPCFECFMHNHRLNVTEDLECGKKLGVYGKADGFDALGRGTA